MMVYVNGQDIKQLVLGGWSAAGWQIEPTSLTAAPEEYLANLDLWLAKANLKKSDITGFVLVKGPGSATALRMSHALVNALAFALGVPVISVPKALDSPDLDLAVVIQDKSPHSFAVPEYAFAPKITVSNRDALRRKSE